LMCFFTRRVYTLGTPEWPITGTIGKYSGENITLHNILHSKAGATLPTATSSSAIKHDDTRGICGTLGLSSLPLLLPLRCQQPFQKMTFLTILQGQNTNSFRVANDP